MRHKLSDSLWSGVGAAEVVSRGYRRGLAWHEPTTQEHGRAIEQPACLASPLQPLPSLSVRNAFLLTAGIAPNAGL
jgi:hypothetical protein